MSHNDQFIIQPEKTKQSTAVCIYANVLDNWQLAVLSQSGGREFDPRQVHDYLSVPLWVYMSYPVPEHQN